MTELLIGCGWQRDRRINTDAAMKRGTPWENLVTLDHNPEVGANFIHDLRTIPYPFLDNTFDEVHAYEVLEHIGQQGDYLAFFAQFTELWRILKPGGFLCATCPAWDSLWAWGDPSHTRIISEGSLIFLSQKEYLKQQGKTPMTDFRYIYKADFDIVWQQKVNEGQNFAFMLQAVKDA